MVKALQTRSKLRLPHDLVCEGSSAGGVEGVQMAGGEEVISFGGTLQKKNIGKFTVKYGHPICPPCNYCKMYRNTLNF